MAILDQYGKPIKSAELKKPAAGPTLGGVRQVITGHPADGLTPRRLAAIHQAAADGDPLRYLELAEDIEERDLHYLGVMATRKRAVAQLPITVKAASDSAEHKKHAAHVQSWIDDEVLQDSLFDMLDAIGKGFSVLEVEWRYHRGHLCPRDFTWRPQSWFEFDRLDGETVLLRDGTGGEILEPHRFLIHRHKSKSGLTIRSGLARVASWAWMYKAFTLRDWAIFTQNFGMPIRVGKYGPNASEEEKDVLWRAVSQIAGDCAAIIPDGMVIEFTEVGAKTSSSKLYEDRVDWFDRQISKAVLGQTTTTDAVSGGHAVAKEHRLVQEDIERADAKMVSGTINTQLVPNIVAFEFGPQDVYPKVSIGRPDEVELGEFAEAFAKLAPLGLTAPASYLRSRMQIPEAKGDEEMVGGRAPAPSPMAGLDFQEPGSAGGTTRPSLPARPSGIERMLASRQSRQDGEQLIDRMTRRIEDEAAGAIAGLAGEIRSVLEQSGDLREAVDKLSRMNLDPAALSEAMGRALALSHLCGQAALMDELDGR
ncbi:DUF935 domain-containing protein [Fulvimarina endophytica]|nr:DUF935 domain-containing protein [Fulvimarina endophytica]